MNIRLKISTFILSLAALFSLFGIFAYADGGTAPDVSHANAVCLYNVNAEKNILSKNMQEKIFPGSAVKMMTGLIACEQLSDRLGERVTVTEEMLDGVQGYSVKLTAGMSVTLEELLYGAVCGCGNDAASALAVICGGSVDGFVEIMNAKAIEWGMKSTRFTNPTGLDDENMYSTLADLMIAAKKAYGNKLYLEISSAPSYVYTPEGYAEQIKFFNRNALISTFYSIGYRNLFASGIIAGNTELGGYCVITYAEKRNTGYICAVMGADADENTIYSYEIANSLLDFAFDSYSYVKIAQGGQYICDIPVKLAMPETNEKQTSVECVIKSDVYTLTYSEISDTSMLKYRYYFHGEALNAPVAEGEIVGGVDIIYNGEIIGTAMLVTAETAEASKILVLLDSMRELFTGRFFWFSVLFFVLLFLAYLYITELRFRRKKTKKLNYRNYY